MSNLIQKSNIKVQNDSLKLKDLESPRFPNFDFYILNFNFDDRGGGTCQ